MSQVLGIVATSLLIFAVAVLLHEGWNVRSRPPYYARIAPEITVAALFVSAVCGVLSFVFR